MNRRPNSGPTDAVFRAVKWGRLPGRHTIAEACKRYGVTPSAYRKARREVGNAPNLASDDEIVLAGLTSGPGSIDVLLRYYDWVNHSVLSTEEMATILERLIADGLVRRAGECFELACGWP